MYLRSFTFPDGDREYDYLLGIKRQCYSTFYPFKVLSQCELGTIDFDPITIFYGGNGSGKTTALNVIADTLEITRDSVYNRSNFFPDFVRLCQAKTSADQPADCRIITSDDVFDYMLNIRNLNDGIHKKRETLFDDYLDAKYATFRMTSLNDYDRLKKVNSARRNTQSKFVRDSLMSNIREQSNGESGYMYFTEHIKENGLYLLDEPENSLSPEKQQALVTFIEESTRFFGCQFIISTHSPFILAMKGAKIYDLDETPAKKKLWTELKNVRIYYDFFKRHDGAF